MTGKANQERLAAAARKRRGAIPMNRAERRAQAQKVMGRKTAEGHKGSGAEIRAARKMYALGLRQREKELAKTRAQVVDPETGKTVAEPRRRLPWQRRKKT